jgi:hypothetical protein
VVRAAPTFASTPSLSVGWSRRTNLSHVAGSSGVSP